MNKINPLTILLITIAIFLSSFILLKQSAVELKSSYSELSTYEELSSKYTKLKQAWDKKADTVKLLDKVIKSSGINNIDRKVENKKIILKFSDDSLSKIDKFVNKILNENLNILQLNITQNSVELVVGY